MGRHSIKFKIALMLSIIISSLLVLLLLLNSTQAEHFYLQDKQKQMLSGYEHINDKLMEHTTGKITEEQMYADFEQFTTNSSFSIIVVSSDWSTVYTNINGEDEMINRLKMSMFNRDIFDRGDAETATKAERETKNSDSQEEVTQAENSQKDSTDENPEQPEQLEQFGMPPMMRDKSHGEAIDMNNSGIVEKREIIEQNNNYTLQKVYDDRLSGDYYELWGSLDNGDSIMMRMAIQGIRDTVAISNKFITYIGIVILIVGVAVAYSFSTYIANPIKTLSNLAERMANMDFNARYEENDKSELGILGQSMNNMSEKLEQNISQLKTANLELQRDIDRKIQIDEMRSDFLSNVSHELKTPIALIQGYAEGLKEGISDDPESMEFYCDVIIDEANKMNMMVKKLLTLNQIEFGNEELIMERFNIIELLRSCVMSNELRAAQRGITIEFEPKEESIDVWSDEYKIEEVITNYLSNAINHCAGELKIKVTIVRMGDLIRVYVYNTGEHIPEADLNKIWTKFYKVDKARTREYGGNGIGLSIVKAIMDSYGKSCGVENVDKGVRFWFDLDAKA